MAFLILSGVRAERSRFRWSIPLAAGLASVLFVSATGPTAAWRHSPIGAGRVDLSKASPNRLREWERDFRRRLVWQADGVESSVALLTTSGGVAFVINGKIDGNSRKDAPTQVMGGLIGAALHVHPKRALVIGLGTGSTAGWLAAVPTIERVDVVELEPVIRHVAEVCAPVNHNVLDNPKVKVTIGDAREYLATSRDSYDLIFSEPSNPYRAGISSLFTAEFYRAVRRRLAPGGIFLQWLQSYEVDPETVRTVYATLQGTLPQVESWFSLLGDLILVATTEPISYETGTLRERLSTEPFRSAMQDAWATEGLEGFLSHYIARPSFVAGLLGSSGAPVNTDDRNVVEFAFARSLGRKTLFDLQKARRQARQHGEDTPSFEHGTVDWPLVARLRISTITADGVVPSVGPELAGEELRQTLVQKSFLEGRPDLVLERWRAAPWEPVGSVELATVAQALADAGEESATVYIDRLRETRSVEAEILFGQLRWRQQRFAEAADRFERAFSLYRENPWPLLSVMNKSFTTVADIAGRGRALATQLDNALAAPFAVLLLNEERLQTRYKLATYLDQSKLEEAIAALEPHVPWRRAFLDRRAKVYEATGNPRAPIARRELAEFLKHDTGKADASSAPPLAGDPQ
jgi:spermidine synthase